MSNALITAAFMTSCDILIRSTVMIKFDIITFMLNIEKNPIYKESFSSKQQRVPTSRLIFTTFFKATSKEQVKSFKFLLLVLHTSGQCLYHFNSCLCWKRRKRKHSQQSISNAIIWFDVSLSFGNDNTCRFGRHLPFTRCHTILECRLLCRGGLGVFLLQIHPGRFLVGCRYHDNSWLRRYEVPKPYHIHPVFGKHSNSSCWRNSKPPVGKKNAFSTRFSQSWLL